MKIPTTNTLKQRQQGDIVFFPFFCESINLNNYTGLISVAQFDAFRH